MSGLSPARAADAALIAILTHVASSDGAIEAAELAFLEKVLPGRNPDDLREWAMAARERPLDLAAVARALPGIQDRWTALRFAARMAWKDGAMAPEEHALLARLVQALKLPDVALTRMLDQAAGRGPGTVDPARLKVLLQKSGWDAVTLLEGGPSSDLAGALPEDWAVVGTVVVDGLETATLCADGIVGRFAEGIRAVPWSDLVTTMLDTLGATVLLTEAGETLTLRDFRMAGLAAVVEKLHAEPAVA